MTLTCSSKENSKSIKNLYHFFYKPNCIKTGLKAQGVSNPQTNQYKKISYTRKLLGAFSPI